MASAFLKVSGSFFCGFDDFDQLRRTTFEDARDPARVFTTSHFNSYKYRPLERVFHLLTVWAGGGHPLAFRIRNLGAHLLNVLILYALTRRLFGSPGIAAWAACLFGLHPVASVSVVGAMWANTLAHCAALAALLLFLTSVQEARYRWARLVACLALAWVAQMTYDSDVVILGLMTAYLGMQAWSRRGPPLTRRFVLTFAVIAILFQGSAILLRAHFVPNAWSKAGRGVTSAGVVARNVVLYALALGTPIDPVLANEAFDTPLPSEIRMSPAQLSLAGISLLLVLAAVGLLVGRRMPSPRERFDGVSSGLLLLGIIAPLLPVLLLESHPSETYLYLSVAFYMPLLIYALHWFLGGGTPGRPRVIYRVVTCSLLALFAAATWTRNERLTRCGETAERILDQIPDSARLREGAWTLWFANVPGEERSRRYACYGYRGTDTIGDGPFADQAMTGALRLRFANERLVARVVEAQALSQTCPELPPGQICLWVHSDGRIEEWAPSTASR